jgi:hypothetical protein
MPARPERYIPLPTAAPHGTAEWQKAYEDIQRCLVSALQKVEQEYSTAAISPHDSVYVGVAGAFTSLSVACWAPNWKVMIGRSCNDAIRPLISGSSYQPTV